MIEVHVLASGSDGNCFVIKCDDHAVMVDAGISGKKVIELLETHAVEQSCIKSILLTHEHSDHALSVGTLARKLGVPVVCNENTFHSANIGKVLYRKIETMVRFESGPISILPMPTSHKAAEPNAFSFEIDDHRIVLATDTGKVTPEIEKSLSNADVALIESNYDDEMLRNGPYPIYLKKWVGSEIGHLSNFDCAAALKRTMNSKRRVFLAHISKNNNTPDLARETVAQITGMDRRDLRKLDCMERQGDTRRIKV